MKLVIIGYGKMGRSVQEAAEKIQIPISKIIKSYKELKNYQFQPEETAIEFTTPNACIKNIKILAEKKVSVICGTTGWYDKMDELKSIVSQHSIGFLYGENFSLGVHLFWKSVSATAQSFGKLSEYNVSVHEEHHAQKKDIPSGTAKKTAEILIQNLKTKDGFKVMHSSTQTNTENIIPIFYDRKGEIFGKHVVRFESPLDTIELTHNSKGRNGYALGAIKCAKWLANRKGFFSIDDYINSTQLCQTSTNTTDLETTI